MDDKKDILKQFKLKRILWPVLISLAGTFGVLFYKDIVASEGGIREGLANVHWTGYSFLWLFLGLVMMGLRDLAYTWRMHTLAEGSLSWKNTWSIIFLWEFSSALTPSVVGGSAFAIAMLHKEKIPVGRGTAIVFTTILLDEIFYVLILPVVLVFMGPDQIFAPFENMGESASLFGLTGFWIAYGVIIAYTALLIFALIIYPKGTYNFLTRLFMSRPLRRWRRKGIKAAKDMMIAAEDLSRKPFRFWLEASAATMLAWMSRYLVLNCILAAFAVTALGLTEHIIAFARQAVLFLVMLVSPTPGSSGIAELMFVNLLEDMTPTGLAEALAALWRFITYYPYLIIGLIVLPHWVKRVFAQDQSTAVVEEEPQKIPQGVNP